MRQGALYLHGVLLAAVISSSMACKQGFGPDDLGPTTWEDLPGALVAMNDAAAAKGGATFFNAPYPSDLRLINDAHPTLDQMPGIAEVPLLQGIAETLHDMNGNPQLSVAYFAFDKPIAAAKGQDVVLNGKNAAAFYLDVDADSPEFGRVIPVVAESLEPDRYVARPVLAIAPVPGIILRPKTRYAAVVLRAWNDAEGAPLGVPGRVRALLAGEAGEDDAWSDLALDVAAGLDKAGIDPDSVAAFTAFSTGDVVSDMFDLTERVRDSYDAVISDLGAAADRGVALPSYCELSATVAMPEFQRGTAPYDTQGLFEYAANGAPVAQRTVDLPVTLAIPDSPMPIGGFPLLLYIHGSGGSHDEPITRGPQPEGGEAQMGYGPAWVDTRQGIAVVSTALPVNPERVPGASSYAYLNFNNLAAFRDTFREGIVEQRLFLDAILALEIPAEAAQKCSHLTLPSGVDSITFNASRVIIQGQSMGGMYTNMVGAVEPRAKIVVPTGAGGHWTRFILETSLLGDGIAGQLVKGLLKLEHKPTWLHPAMHLTQTAWEWVEPMVYTSRLARNPLPGHPVRPIYEPVGLGDSYFPTSIYDAMALSYGNHQAGDVIWDTMQPKLKLEGRGGLEHWPVANNAESESGKAYTGVVVQYEGDGYSDPHAIYVQLPEVRHQYGCFLGTWLRTGIATVPAPGPDTVIPNCDGE